MAAVGSFPRIPTSPRTVQNTIPTLSNGGRGLVICHFFCSLIVFSLPIWEICHLFPVPRTTKAGFNAGKKGNLPLEPTNRFPSVAGQLILNTMQGGAVHIYWANCNFSTITMSSE